MKNGDRVTEEIASTPTLATFEKRSGWRQQDIPYYVTL